MAELSRRELLGRVVPKALELVARQVESRLDRAFPPRRRPPGAVEELTFLSLCTRCNACSEACPHAAIHTFSQGTEGLAGTPVLVPDARPCRMCEGFPCAVACKEGALLPPDEDLWPLGDAAIREDRCIAFAGPECGACASLCPNDVDALHLERARPSIDRDSCVGCGICIEACPTIPAAIELLPLEQGASDR